MSLPDEAVFECMLAGGVALYDVSHLLPTAAKKYPKRPVEGIVRCYFHHSGADGAAGFKGPYNSTQFVVNARSFRGAAYTFWFPYEELTDEHGNLVVLRLNKDDVRSYHTGKDANTHGVGVCFQGNLSKKPPSSFQIELAEAFIPWAMEHYKLSLDNTPISYHNEAAQFGGKQKATCPGPYVIDWLDKYRRMM